MQSQSPNHVKLNANRKFSIYYFFNRILCCLLNFFFFLSQVLFFPTIEGTVRSLISRHPQHTAAAACVYLCACVQWVHNLSIYVCVSVYVRVHSTGCPAFERVPTPCAHTPQPPTTNYKLNLNFGKGPRFTESSHSRGMPDRFQQAEQNALSFMKQQ